MINQLVSKIKKTSAPIVVGLDPMMKFVPGIRPILNKFQTPTC